MTTLGVSGLTDANDMAVDLSPAFASATTSYTALVANEISSVTVVATATDTAATVVVTPADSDGRTAGHQVAVTGPTVITATVTNGGDKQTCVIRAAPVDPNPGPLWSATLTPASGFSPATDGTIVSAGA